MSASQQNEKKTALSSCRLVVFASIIEKRKKERPNVHLPLATSILLQYKVFQWTIMMMSKK